MERFEEGFRCLMATNARKVAASSRVAFRPTHASSRRLQGAVNGGGSVYQRRGRHQQTRPSRERGGATNRGPPCTYSWRPRPRPGPPPPGAPSRAWPFVSEQRPRVIRRPRVALLVFPEPQRSGPRNQPRGRRDRGARGGPERPNPTHGIRATQPGEEAQAQAQAITVSNSASHAALTTALQRVGICA